MQPDPDVPTVPYQSDAESPSKLTPVADDVRDQPQFTLKDLFGIVAYCAVAAWCIAFVGINNSVFWIAFVIGSAASVHFVYVAVDEQRRRSLLYQPLLVLFVCPCLLSFVSLSLLTQGILLTALGAVCNYRPLTLRPMIQAVVLISTVSLAVGVVPGLLQDREYQLLKRKFPAVSLAPRLAYELSRQQQVVPPGELSKAVRQRLQEDESSKIPFGGRRYQLERLHRDSHVRFVRSLGFGVGRMIRGHVGKIPSPILVNIPFQGKSAGENQAFVDYEYRSYRKPAGLSGDVSQLHEVSRDDFLDSYSFGFVILPKTKIAGFMEHAFHSSPLEQMPAADEWTIERLELVSLLKFPEPRVYVLDHLPRMDQLAATDVPTRALDEFEEQAVSQLRTQEDLVVTSAGSQYRMLGSLRASTQCLQCHSVARGELLGAFSYVLSRAEHKTPVASTDEE